MFVNVREFLLERFVKICEFHTFRTVRTLEMATLPLMWPKAKAKIYGLMPLLRKHQVSV